MNVLIILAQAPAYSYEPTYHWPWYVRIPLILFVGRALMWAGDALSKNKPSASRVPPAIPSTGGDSVTNTPAGPSNKPTHGVLIAGYACALVSLLFMPPFLGLAGVICGVVAINRERKNAGIILIIVSFVGAVIGMIYGAVS